MAAAGRRGPLPCPLLQAAMVPGNLFSTGLLSDEAKVHAVAHAHEIDPSSSHRR